MNGHWTTLKRALVDRANALGSYIEGMQADSARSDDGFAGALKLCRLYTEAFVSQIDADWEDAYDDAERIEFLTRNVELYLERERWIDQRFARGTQRDVPRALKTIARHEFKASGLDGHEPVLTVGPPDSFETHQASLNDYLFTDIHVKVESPELAGLRRGDELSIFSVPYIEGTRALWYPIVLGHEAAHIRLDNSRGLGTRAGMFESWLRPEDAEYGEIVEDAINTLPKGVSVRVELLEQLERWATELICDLNAVRLYGPAGLSAIAEFLAILASQRSDGVLDSQTHPPLRVRLKLMFAFLKELKYPETGSPRHVEVWREYERSEPVESEPRARFLSRILTTQTHMDQLIDMVKQWDRLYEAGDNLLAIDQIRQELLDGVPGATHVRAGDRSWRAVTVADVVNGAWAARSVLDDKEAGQPIADTGRLVDSLRLSPHEKRLRLDSLASKAIDTLELSRLWGSERGVTTCDDIDRWVPLAPEVVTASGVLSRRVIAERLGHGIDQRRTRLVVSPLFEDSVQDAAIDLRLGPDFIVFRHSATEAFDPLSEDQDPRMLQERVHKAWGEKFVLHPRELVLAATLEYIVLPDDVAAQVVTRSSYGRLGLMTATAVQVQPGSRGCITLELVNHGETPIALTPATRVAQLMLWSVMDPCEVAGGKYWFPVGPEFSKVESDEDADALRKLARAALENVGRSASRPRARVVFAGGRREADLFYDYARREGAEDVFERIPTHGEHRLGAAADVLSIIAAVSATIHQLSMAILRWQQAQSSGVVITLLEDGTVSVRSEQSLPRGTTVYCSRDGVEIERVVGPPANSKDIAEALSRLRRRE